MIVRPSSNGGLCLVPIAAAFILFTDVAAAQQVGKRKSAPPAAEAKLARIVTKADLEANKSKGGGSLKADQLSVTKNCGNVQIGGTDAAEDSAKQKSLIKNNSLRKENVTVVRGSTVNICR